MSPPESRLPLAELDLKYADISAEVPPGGPNLLFINLGFVLDLAGIRCNCGTNQQAQKK